MATPDTTALLAPDRELLTYRQLQTRIETSQAEFLRAGLLPGEAAALVFPNGPELITAFLALAGIGAAALLDPSLTQDEYENCLRRLRARTLVLLAGAPSPSVDAARALGMRIVSIRARPDQPAGVFDVVDGGAGQVLDSGRKTDAALLLFTSATTDSPKLVPLTWPNLRAIAANDSRALGLNSSDRLLSMMPLFHLHGLAAVLTQLYSGGSVISTPRFDPASLPRWLAEFRPTWLCSNPPMNRAMLAVARQRPEAFRDTPLRFIRSGTAASDPELLGSLETAIGVPVVNGYGLTETGGATRELQGRRKPGSVGQSSGLELAIADPEGNILPPNSEGEIVVRGPSVTPGYLDNPEANLEAFRDGWLRTGDIGHMDQEGFLFITGRLKELINRGGKKIAPQEVEAALLAHPAVAQAAACGVPHPTLGENVAAVIVPRNGAVVSESELRRFVATKLASFKVPHRIAIVESIPLTATGKPRRSLLAEQLLRERAPHSAAARDLEPVESALIDIWRRVLAVEKVQISDDFFALGGDSLSAAVMLIEAQRQLQANTLLERVDFFDDPTIESLARIAIECGANPSPAPVTANLESQIVPLRSTGTLAPFFCLPASAQSPYYLRHLAKSLDPEQPFLVVSHAQPVRDNRLLPLQDLARSAAEAIRSERPHGPYILGGHCYGGVVAFEAALQLMSQGEQILGLVLFDTATPGHLKVRKHWRRYVAKAREVTLALARGRMPVTARQLGQHLHMLGYIFSRRSSANASRALAVVGSDLLVAGRQEKDLQGMTMWEYAPREFAAPIIHFIAADQPISTEVLTDPRLGWSAFARAGLEVRHVPGDHNSILAPENSVGLAEQLNRWLPHRALARAAAV